MSEQRPISGTFFTVKLPVPPSVNHLHAIMGKNLPLTAEAWNYMKESALLVLIQWQEQHPDGSRFRMVYREPKVRRMTPEELKNWKGRISRKDFTPISPIRIEGLPAVLGVTIDAYLPVSSFMRRDWDGIPKLAQDTVAETLGFNDNKIVVGGVRKHPSVLYSHGDSIIMRWYQDEEGLDERKRYQDWQKQQRKLKAQKQRAG